MLSSIVRASKMSMRSVPKACVVAPMRFMADAPHQISNILIPCDPNFIDEEVIAVLNPVTKKIEPVIVAVPESSFEFLYCSPMDLHTMDVTPVAKECIDPNSDNIEYEAQ